MRALRVHVARSLAACVAFAAFAAACGELQRAELGLARESDAGRDAHGGSGGGGGGGGTGGLVDGGAGQAGGGAGGASGMDAGGGGDADLDASDAGEGDAMIDAPADTVDATPDANDATADGLSETCSELPAFPLDWFARQPADAFDRTILGFFGAALGGPEPELLNLIMYSNANFPLGPGTYNVANFPAAVIATLDLGGTTEVNFFSVSGKLELGLFDESPTGNVAGRVYDVTLRFALKLPDGTLQVVPSGPCVHFAELQFDTLNVVGKPCNPGCGNPLSGRVCNSDTLLCMDGDCVTSADCAAGKTCARLFSPYTKTGLCLDACTPFGSPGCAATQTCIASDDSLQSGACGQAGDSPAFTPCALTAGSTGCAPGTVCTFVSNTSNFCFPQCNYFGADPGCPPGTVCWSGRTAHFSSDVYPNTQPFCAPVQPYVDAAAVGAPCSAASPVGAPCGHDGLRVGGTCLPGASGSVCTARCRFTPDSCPTGQSCHDLNEELTSGYCQ